MGLLSNFPTTVLTTEKISLLVAFHYQPVAMDAADNGMPLSAITTFSVYIGQDQSRWLISA